MSYELYVALETYIWQSKFKDKIIMRLRESFTSTANAHY